MPAKKPDRSPGERSSAATREVPRGVGVERCRNLRPARVGAGLSGTADGSVVLKKPGNAGGGKGP